MAVNKPVNEQQMHADIDRKLRFYGIITAFKNGKVPTNEQIDIALNSFLGVDGISDPPNELSSDGKLLIADVREVIRHAKNLILSKNSGDLLQQFIWQTSQFNAESIGGVDAPVDKEKAKRDGNDALDGLRTLGTLLITNGQFRKLLKDATLLFRDIAGDAAANAANRVRPSEDQLSQIDHPAEDHTWHEKPNFSKENFRKQAGRVYSGDAKGDAKDVVGTAQDAAANGGNVRDAVSNVVQQKAHEKTDPEDREKAQELAQAKKEEARRKAREYLNKKMPQERKDQAIWRLKKMVLECQQHPEYSQAVQSLLDLAEQYGRHSKNVTAQVTDKAKGTRSNLATAEENLRTLLERFANGTSAEDLIEAIKQIYQDADQDRELGDWFRSLDRYIRRCLLEQGYILDDTSTEDWDQLYEHGRYLLRDKYRVHTDRVLNEVKFLGDQFDQDPQNQAFRTALEKLFSDLGHDQNGNTAFKPHLIKDLTNVILPRVLANVAYVPIPRVEYTDPQVDAVIENIVLQSDNFTPNMFEFHGQTHWKWDRTDKDSTQHHTLEAAVKGVQMDMRNVSYYIKRKKGFPAITDEGIVNILLPGDGFGFRVKMATPSSTDRQNFFKIEKVDINISKLKVKFVKSSHKLLLSLVKPIILKALRPVLQTVIEKTIKDQVNRLDSFLFQIKKEVDEAKQQVIEDPSQAQSIYSRYARAFQNRISQTKKKAEEKVAGHDVNVAIANERTILPDVKLPGGISNKATEYRELAHKGNEWRSDVFAIGSAARSNDIPSTPRITRKPHDAGPKPNLDSTSGGGFYNGSAAGNTLYPGEHGATSYSTGTTQQYSNAPLGNVSQFSGGQIGNPQYSSVPTGHAQYQTGQVDNAQYSTGQVGNAQYSNAPLGDFGGATGAHSVPST